jgi:hypothetical protein
MYEHALGPEHPDTALSLWWLAVISQQDQQYAESESLYTRALGIYEQQLGEEHPQTQHIRRQYNSQERVMGRENEASALEAGRHDGVHVIRAEQK